MTTIARQANIRIIANETALAQLLVDIHFAAIAAAERESFETCQLCGHTVVELFARIDNRDNAEIEICEDCADNGNVSHIAD